MFFFNHFLFVLIYARLEKVKLIKHHIIIICFIFTNLLRWRSKFFAVFNFFWFIRDFFFLLLYDNFRCLSFNLLLFNDCFLLCLQDDFLSLSSGFFFSSITFTLFLKFFIFLLLFFFLLSLLFLLSILFFFLFFYFLISMDVMYF